MVDRKRKCPSKACYCAVLTAWLVVAFIVFLVSCWLYLGPLLRVLRYRYTSCEVTNTFYTTRFICHCPETACKSSYPCLLVHVAFNVSDEMWTVALYKDELQQEAVISVDQDAQEWCSLKVCNRDSLANLREIEAFQDRYGHRGFRLQCAYDPWNVQNGAVISITPITLVVFHALFWPFLGIVIGITLCVIFCQRCRKEDSGKEGDEGTASVQLTKVEEGNPGPTENSNHGNKSHSEPATSTRKNKLSFFKKQKNVQSLDAANDKRTRIKAFSKSKSLFK